MEKLKSKFKNILMENNYKLTKQREIILGTIISRKNWHFTAEELFSAVKENYPDIGMATIYRTLELFQNLGIVHMLDFGEGSRQYELSFLETQHHHHLICKKCGKLIEFNDQDLEYFEKKLEIKYNFRITEHKLRFYGLCKECISKK
ncbi:MULTISPECIES: Fur family transcriptional regulator [unclassified Halanaerobium]|uniref:Fur family transcriptional regulator n=1 Tax=unclassified Halanaerobium TaxID=2641197 RepID=UPI000DF3BFAC|nr:MULTISPECIES: Fur family transcriptional regulator [unclassified Halanaerobium]RCW50505.1 Fur family ferric uptake transcriptional regulator [Halanaerobium sp. MA284_MarDTE_T2]RCW85992.1 Fur family ferric uptake transcriptional regulator [Halanaerobium sp. DL-01]